MNKSMLSASPGVPGLDEDLDKEPSALRAARCLDSLINFPVFELNETQNQRGGVSLGTNGAASGVALGAAPDSVDEYIRALEQHFVLKLQDIKRMLLVFEERLAQVESKAQLPQLNAQEDSAWMRGSSLSSLTHRDLQQGLERMRHELTVQIDSKFEALQQSSVAVGAAVPNASGGLLEKTMAQAVTQQCLENLERCMQVLKERVEKLEQGRPETEGSDSGDVESLFGDVKQTPTGLQDSETMKQLESLMRRVESLEGLEESDARRRDSVMREIGDLDWKPQSLLRYFFHGYILESVAHAREIEPTLWEAVLLIKARSHAEHAAFQASTNVALICATILSTITQLLFILSINQNFPISPLSQEPMKLFRSLVGHTASETDALGHSLISRVCTAIDLNGQYDPTLVVAQQHANFLADLNTYTGDLPIPGLSAGMTLCTITLVLWFLLWMKEAYEAFEICIAILCLPKSSGLSLQVGSKSGIIKMVTTSYGRCICVVLVTVIRISVATFLMINGTLWLVYTHTLTDIILNGVALAFIYDTDESFYDIFIPKNAGVILEALEPFEMPRLPARLLTSGVSLLIYLSVVLWLLLGHKQNVKKIMQASCDGERDFVYAHHGGFNVFFATQTLPYEDSNPLTLDIALDYIDYKKGRVQDMGFQVLPSLAKIQTYRRSDSQELAETLRGDCSDTNPNIYPGYWKHLNQALNANHTQCTDAEDQCLRSEMVLLRVLCPSTCRCWHVDPISAVMEGCPTKRCKDAGTSVYYSPAEYCKQRNASELSKSIAWKQFWESYTTYLASDRLKQVLPTRWSGALKGKDKPAQIREYAAKHGCDVISRFDMATWLCSQNAVFQAIAAYCPIACGCHGANGWKDAWQCPYQNCPSR